MSDYIDTKGTIIISGFPGVGKSYCVNSDKFNELKMLDSDSSSFSHITENINGINIKKSNPMFPDNYIDHIKANLGKCDIIFVSTHGIVREALKEEKIPYVLVYPYIEEETDIKVEYIARYQKRKNDSTFIDFMIKNWDKFVGECFIESWPIHYKLEKNEYLSDVLLDIYEINKINFSTWNDKENN